MNTATHTLKFFRRTWLLSALFLLGSGVALHAQELTVLGGVLPKTDAERSSYTWQVDYRQDFFRNFAASIGYINEGHLRAHHRDGTAWQVWGVLPFAEDKFSLSLGVGAYYYFDTQPLPGGDSADVHGTAPVFSVAATGYFADRWYYRFNFNRIAPTGQINVNTLTAGMGFWFGQDRKPTAGKLGDAPNEKAYVSEKEITLFGGQSVVNTFLDQKSLAYAAEFRQGLVSHIDWTASAIYEGNPQIVRRSGLATQLWAVNTFFEDRITVGAGLGPYIYLDQKHPATGTGKLNPAAVAPLASLTFSVRLSGNWVMRMVFDRVMSNYNRDSDVFLLGLGYRWGK
jgi:hypothetical protein